ncbi:MAG: hypothetical protein RR891_09665 [Clostridium sp.]|uniref:hypothetical protein n=1 Tax=Clostridium sp. TaxID=1506 RepID=UPI00304487BB
MKYFLYAIAIVALILLFPIPIKITLTYLKGIFTVKLYNKTIVPSEGKKSKKENKSNMKKRVENLNYEDIQKFKINDIVNVFNFIINSKFKGSIRTNIHVDYSIEDAAINAITYGLINQFSGYVAVILNLFFNVDGFNSSINMKYDEHFFELKSSSIISINIATIIYIVISSFYIFKKGRKQQSYRNVNLKEEFKNG